MPTVLIVEDEAHILRVMSMWLGRHGYEVLEAADGVAALELIDREPVDIIISDMNMPRLNGLELVKAVREERGLEVPFLLLTARCDQDALFRDLAPYHVHLYPKPFAPSRLAADIDRLIGAEAPGESPG